MSRRSRRFWRDTGKDLYLKKREEELLGLSQEEAITRDGHRIKLAANINSLAELDAVRQVNGDRIGLYGPSFSFYAGNTFLMKNGSLKSIKKSWKRWREGR